MSAGKVWWDRDVNQPPDSTDPAGLGQLAVDLALGAGQLIRSRRAGGFGVFAKSTPTDMVTEVDRAVEAWLVDQLRHWRPQDTILGEEGGGRPGSSDVRWLLDPIDGTVNFVLGLPAYAVSVAAEVAGVTVAGAVHNPASGELFRAVRGGGAFLGDEPLRGPRDVPINRAVVGTGFAYDPARRARQGEVVARLLGRVADIRRWGSAALDLCAVAAGRLDAYFEAGLNAWDRAAGLLVVEEAGAVTSGLCGAPPGDRMTAVAHRAHAEALFALLEEVRAHDVG
jgi:myo-inositol-1(or 4)-monophosphatase